MMMNAEPNGVIDHKDGNPFNNKWSNLRDCAYFQNSLNQKVNSTNKLGVKGISYIKNRKKYEVKLSVRGIEYWGGYYSTLETAKEVYKNMAIKYHGE
jgi:hypothetical protein